MKIRKEKYKYEWVVFPSSDKFKNKTFKRFDDAKKYLVSMGADALETIVRKDIKTFNSLHTECEYFIWFNKYENINKKQNLCLTLNRVHYRNKKFISRKTSKSDLNYFKYSNRVISLMCHIANERVYNDSNLKNLIEIFKKRFGELPNNPNGYGESINKLNDCKWWCWSDRCGYDRASVIIKCIRNEKPYLLNL